MNDITTILANLLRRLRGESAAKTITRKQDRIAAVAARETTSINGIVNAELASVRTFVTVSLRKIDDLAATGALDAETNRAVGKLRAYLGSASATI